MQLPAKPRLRVSFWYEGEGARCEFVLMGERRELVHRETLDVGPGTGLETVHAALLAAAATLASAKAFASSGGVAPAAAVATVPPPRPPAPPPSPEQIEAVASERARRSAAAGERAEEQAFELELEQQAAELERTDQPTPAPQLTPDELAEERERRARANTVIQNANSEPPPSEPNKSE
jgi:hypothetical protein